MVNRGGLNQEEGYILLAHSPRKIVREGPFFHSRDGDQRGAIRGRLVRCRRFAPGSDSGSAPDTPHLNRGSNAGWTGTGAGFRCPGFGRWVGEEGYGL